MGTYQVSGAVTKILPVSMLTDGKKLEFIPVSYLTRCSPYAEVLALRGLVWQNLLNYRAHMHLSLSDDL